MTFHYKNRVLYAENVDLYGLAETYGTPLYVYSSEIIAQNYQAFTQGLNGYPHQICYAVKANSTLAILAYLARLGAGFDIVSLGELYRVIKAGGKPNKIIFSGIGKSAVEISDALKIGIGCFNIESLPELLRLQNLAESHKITAPIAFRINPDVDPKSHPYISTGLKESKFGIPIKEAVDIYTAASKMPWLEIKGIACHIGSQITTLSPFLEALEKILTLRTQLKSKNIAIQHIDLGGGLAIPYQNEIIPSRTAFTQALVKQLSVDTEKLPLILEPGRAIVGDAGVLITKIEYIKPGEIKNFCITDAGMNDLLRPALYNAYQSMLPVLEQVDTPEQLYDVVGPVCETSDFLGKARLLKIKAGDYLAILQAGAYGFSMSSQYNTRPRAAEILIENNKAHLIRKRETISSLYALENFMPSNGAPHNE